MDPGLREVVEEKASALTLTDYMEAMQVRAELGIAMSRFHDRYDLLLTPATPFAAYLADHDGVDAATKQRWTDRPAFTFPFNMTGQPAASVPCGMTPDGLPAGLQIVGRMHDDVTVMRAARAFEAASHKVAWSEMSARRRSERSAWDRAGLRTDPAPRRPGS
jgi:aspartyl-tRNA(Asn)/glutamyl-tRNA(Gln) amidotransferase subunit A